MCDGMVAPLTLSRERLCAEEGRRMGVLRGGEGTSVRTAARTWTNQEAQSESE